MTEQEQLREELAFMLWSRCNLCSDSFYGSIQEEKATWEFEEKGQPCLEDADSLSSILKKYCYLKADLEVVNKIFEKICPPNARGMCIRPVKEIE